MNQKEKEILDKKIQEIEAIWAKDAPDRPKPTIIQQELNFQTVKKPPFKKKKMTREEFVKWKLSRIAKGTWDYSYHKKLPL